MEASISRSLALETVEEVASVDRESVEAAITRFCARHLRSETGAVADAMRYSLLGGGKRLRGVLLMGAYRSAGGTGDASDLAAAIEVVHAYSLVHDDLPCMDNDDMRRGRPAVHVVFGVAAASAAGLAMVPLAAMGAFQASMELGLGEERSARIVRELMMASGGGGMIAGQLLDLEGEGRTLSIDQLEAIHRAKTGALIVASVAIGGIAARATESELDALRRYGSAIGLAFQIADDVLDVTSTSMELGKTAGRDIALGKSTYPAHLGIEGARRRAEELVQEACTALDDAGLLTSLLQRVARYTVTRRS